MALERDQFARIFPGLGDLKLDRYYLAFACALPEFEITTAQRMAAFFAQVGHESSGLTVLKEWAATDELRGAQYEGRADLGNVQLGDGHRYYGRGPIQLTGRANYREVGLALGLPLEENPDLALEIEAGARIAGRFWKTRGLNFLADQGTLSAFRKITGRVNGGQNGAADRENRWHAARAVLKLGAPRTDVPA
jgi:putative chitinase